MNGTLDIDIDNGEIRFTSIEFGEESLVITGLPVPCPAPVRGKPLRIQLKVR